jgi:hypothetical protein
MSRKRLIPKGLRLGRPKRVLQCVCGSDDIYIEIFWDLKNVYRITCYRCGLRGSPENYRKTIPLAVKAWNDNVKEFQDTDRIWLEVDRVYETRWDCPIEPEGVRRAA